MARIRTIKPEFWADEDLSELPIEAHMLAASLLNYSDDEGCFNANPKLVKAACCPLREDSVSVHECLIMLSNVGYLRLGKGEDGKQYGQIVNFGKHQRINRPTESKISKQSIAWDDSVNAHGVITEDSPPERKGKEGKGTGNREQGKEQGSGSIEPCQAEILPDPVDLVFQHWQFRMNHPKAKLDDKRKKKIKSAMKLGYTADDLIQAIDGCASSSFHMGQNDRQMVYDGLDLIFRDADHIDKFIKLQQMPAGPGQQEPEWLDGWLSGGGNAGY